MQQRLYDSTLGCRRLADQIGAGGFETPTCTPAGRATKTRGLGQLFNDLPGLARDSATSLGKIAPSSDGAGSDHRLRTSRDFFLEELARHLYLAAAPTTHPRFIYVLFSPTCSIRWLRDRHARRFFFAAVPARILFTSLALYIRLSLCACYCLARKLSRSILAPIRHLSQPSTRPPPTSFPLPSSVEVSVGVSGLQRPSDVLQGLARTL